MKALKSNSFRYIFVFLEQYHDCMQLSLQHFLVAITAIILLKVLNTYLLILHATRFFFLWLVLFKMKSWFYFLKQIFMEKIRTLPNNEARLLAVLVKSTCFLLQKLKVLWAYYHKETTCQV